MIHGVAMAMKNGFGKCGEKFEPCVPDSMAMCSPLDQATRLVGFFSWGKTLPCIGMASPTQKELTKSTSPIRECHTRGVRRGASAAGGLIAFYQIGYGIAGFGVGPLQTWAGLDLNIIGQCGHRKCDSRSSAFGVTPAQDVNKR
jgi:hypothetical protein